MRLRLLAPLLLLAAAPAPKAAHPALWKLADADTTLWLFGTVHALPQGYRWHDAAIDKAIAQSQSLTLEVVLDEHPEELAGILFSLGQGKGLPPLSQRVPADKRALLADLVKESGLPAATLDGMKSWAAAVVLTGVALRRVDIGAASGVEADLTGTFRAAGKPIEGLETARQQLGFFDALPEPAQRRFLAAVLDSPAQTKREFLQLANGWSRGDAREIERAFAEDPEFTPELRDLLIRKRDQAWATALAKRLEQPGTVFVAVGTGHLVGPDSVQHMLAAKGLTVTRVQ